MLLIRSHGDAFSRLLCIFSVAFQTNWIYAKVSYIKFSNYLICLYALILDIWIFKFYLLTRSKLRYSFWAILSPGMQILVLRAYIQIESSISLNIFEESRRHWAIYNSFEGHILHEIKDWNRWPENPDAQDKIGKYIILQLYNLHSDYLKINNKEL